MLHTSSTTRKTAVRLLLVGVAPCAALSCTGRDAELPFEASASNPLEQVTPRAPMADAGITLPYVASVTANGTGCPARTWDIAVTTSGRTFTASFSSFEASIDGKQRIAFKDCNLTTKLHSDTPLTYAVDAFRYDGYSYLDVNVTAFVTANYYFKGNPVPPVSTEKRLDLTGPLDRSFMLDQPLSDDALVWSPCSRDQTLQVLTRVGLRKPQDQGAGYIYLSDFDAYAGGRVKYGMRWRPCVEEVRDGGRASDSGSPDASASQPANAGSIDAASP